MAVILLSTAGKDGVYLCLAADTKPTTITFPSLLPGALAFETDTHSWFIFNGTTWTAYTTAVAARSNLALGASATFTPAATSHTGGDCNGAAQTLALSAVSGSRVYVTDVTLEIDGATVEASAWRLYLYNVTPPSALADDAAWDLPSGDRASFLGYIDLGTAVDLGSTQWVQTTGVNKTLKLAGTGLFAYLVNITTLTPAAVAHIVTLHVTQI